MSATLRDLAAPDPWQASLERSIARRKQTRKPGRHSALSSHASPPFAHDRGKPRIADGRDLSAAEPWELSLGRSRARRRAAQLRFVPAKTRARRISLGTLVALTAAPAASLGDASTNLTHAPAKRAAPPTTTTHEIELTTGSEGRQVRRLQQELGVKVDGIYGPETERAVLTYQASRSLIVDNIVGPQTKAALAAHAPAVISPQQVAEELGRPTATVALERPQRALRAGDHVRTIAAAYSGEVAAPNRLESSTHRSSEAHARHPVRATVPPPQGGAPDIETGGTPTGPANAEKGKQASNAGGTGAVTGLANAEKGKQASSAGGTGTPTATKGSHQSPAGHPVRTLQAALHVVVDGDFGPETEAAIRRFQSEHRLAVTGVAGPETWAALGFHGMKELKPRRTAPPRLARASGTDTGGTGAANPSPDGASAPAASRKPSPSQRPAAQPPAAPGAEGYVNPLPRGFTAGRTDMGVDFSSTPGAPILAIGEAKILGIYPNWYPPGGPNGGNLLEYELVSGPDAGQKVYVAEQIEITVRVGETVKAGAVVGRYAASGTGIETGWGAGGGVTLAQATTGYQEGQETAAGSSFRSFLRSLGSNV